MASAKQLKARKLFAKRVKRGDFRKAIAKSKKTKTKSTTHKKTLKLNPHNPIVEEMKKLEEKYYIKREPTGDATVRRRDSDREIFFIPNLSEFTDPIDISSSPQNNGKILFMLDSGGLVNLPT